MSVSIRLKYSATKDKAPLPTDLGDGELALNTNAASPAAFIKDSAGAVVKLAGVGGVATPDASETVKGIAEIATQAEATAGADDMRIVTPKKLKVELDKKVNLAGDTMTGNLTVPSLNTGQLAGFRNVLINGNLTINQRGVDIAAAATGSYGQDRWKKTAGGMTQIIEEGNFEPGATYTLSGTGITTQQLTAPSSGNWTLPDIPVTARKIQLEPGSVATPFELRHIGIELVLCQRYFQLINFSAAIFNGNSSSSAVLITQSALVNQRISSATVKALSGTATLHHSSGRFEGNIVSNTESTISSGGIYSGRAEIRIPRIATTAVFNPQTVGGSPADCTFSFDAEL